MSVKKSARSNLVPFKRGADPRRGRGPAKGAPNAGRPPEWIRQQMSTHRETAVEQVGDLLELRGVEPKLLLQIVKEFAPPEEQERAIPTLIVKFVRE